MKAHFSIFPLIFVMQLRLLFRILWRVEGGHHWDTMRKMFIE